jgi:DNA-directed RNA polymerase specialized sigma24 family protein
MSPLTVRRYRAERLLREDFNALRGKVLGVVRGRLRASGVSLDPSDLEACYAQAWQGLFEVILEGEEINSPPGWLVTATFRRAIEEHRSRHRSYPTEGVGEPDGFHGGHGAGVGEGTMEHDFAGELDNRIRLRQLFEGLRGRLSAREQEAAALCYLQGFSRADAAARMGISEARMRKLMEGLGAGRPGVAGKVGELVEAIREGSWCEQQGSLMRGYAFGILDPEGERYRLALAHQSECPACRAYIRSLRGLAVVLPAPGLMPLVLGRGAGVGAHTSSGHANTGHPSSGHASAGVGAGSGSVGAGTGVGAVGAVGAGGAAGGGWLFAGGIGTKLAVGCLVAVFSAGCIALNVAPLTPHRAVHHHRHLERLSGAGAPGAQDALSSSVVEARLVPDISSPVAAGGSSSSTRAGVSAALPAAAKVSREFGPEQALAGVSSSSTAASSRNALNAKAASSGPREFSSTPASGGGAAPQARSSSSGGATSNSGSAAQREFGIG